MSDPAQIAPLSDESANELAHVVTEIAIEGVLYGLLSLLTFIAVYLLIRKGLRNSVARLILLTATFVMFGCSTAIFAEDANVNIQQMKALGPSAPDLDKIMKDDLILQNYILGDGIVVWRAWILFDRYSPFRFLLATCLLGTFVSAIVDGVLVARIDSEELGSRRFLLTVMLLITNLTATLLIGYKTWMYRRFFKNHDSNRSKSQIEKILIILVESGLVYCVIWILAICSQAGALSLTADELLVTIVPHAVTLYPIFIIILTSLQKSHNGTAALIRASSQDRRDGDCEFGQRTTLAIGSFRAAPGPAATYSSDLHITQSGVDQTEPALQNSVSRTSDRDGEKSPFKPTPIIINSF
ncbi:hypothetical protein K435DRAFT_970318 [Dendrothele bispora CBS 962.96]|uniref:Family A G protein-coupled receptor-like protein n=1 Tax=Dendrothele bispora (strain CBS 962.96) TaxID=1314807 RepID=A0A4S8LC50_DENBC|nr:hypothetical protein K435DRAFT_846554 [Dendrothele bispora CBS 962.96]THU77229.1 hypothetical protein K435DRAFT_846279 [Dendrothele bispora CBS 962.96]THU86399.1 hypothetical protein K435DRAFT_970318 [Dendrothele bispora CBS 962.96]